MEHPGKRDPAPVTAVTGKRSAAQSGFGDISSSDDDSSSGSAAGAPRKSEAPSLGALAARKSLPKSEAPSLGALAAGGNLPKKSRGETKREQDARRSRQQDEEAEYCDVRSNRCKDYAETGSCP